jgi:hypothetical protein
MSAPYQLPGDLQNQPLGVSWTTLGGGNTLRADAAASQAAMMTIARTATSSCDSEAGQMLRSTLMTETFYAPSHRCGILPSGLGRLHASMNPITKVVYAQVAPANQLPTPSWTQLPVGCAYPEEEPPYGGHNNAAPGGAHGGAAGILFSGNYVNWTQGRMGIRGQVSYLAGWPHTALTSAASTSDMSILVDDVTGWEGATGIITDGGNTELVSCAIAVAALAPPYNAAANYAPSRFVSYLGQNFFSTVANGPNTAAGVVTPGTGSVWMENTEPAGPGTLELVEPLAFDHAAPVLVTTLPSGVRWACALYAKAQALERGIATMTIESAEGSGGGGLGGAINSARTEAAIAIRDYARVY